MSETTIQTDDEELKKYHAARTIWNRREELTPNKKIPWKAWFEQKFGESLDGYARRMGK